VSRDELGSFVVDGSGRQGAGAEHPSDGRSVVAENHECGVGVVASLVKEEEDGNGHTQELEDVVDSVVANERAISPDLEAPAVTAEGISAEADRTGIRPGEVGRCPLGE